MFDIVFKPTYRFNQNKPSGAYHTYVLNEFLTAESSCTTKYFEKTHIEGCSPYLYASFGSKEFYEKYFVIHEQSAIKNSFSTYLCYTLDGLF